MTGSPVTPPPDVIAALDQVDDLVRRFAEHADEAVQEAVVGLLRAVDVLHRGALGRLRAFLDDRSLLDEAVADPHVGLLFELYEAQEEDDERSRAEAAVERIRAAVVARGGRIEVVVAEGGVVNVRLLAADDGDSASTAALRALVENALRAELPEFATMDLAPSSAPSKPEDMQRGLIPVSSVTVGSGGGPLRSGCGSGGGGCSGCR